MQSFFLLVGSLATLFFVIISFGFMVFHYGVESFLRTLSLIDYRGLVLIIFLVFLYHTFDMLRLRTIAEVYKIRYSIFYGYAISFIATFGATVTPAHIGGELIIYYLLRKINVKPTKIIGTITFKTISGLAFFVISLPLAVYYAFVDPVILKKIGFLLIIFLFFSLLSIPLFKNIKKQRNHKFWRMIYLYGVVIFYFWKRSKKAFLLACLYSILLYIVFLSFAPALAFSLHIDIDLGKLYLIQLPLLFAIFSSPSPGGSGVGELGAYAFFQGYIPDNIVGGFIILWRLFSQYLSALVGGILFFFTLRG
jgi:uncharacterized protein (TIRG00374 family)